MRTFTIATVLSVTTGNLVAENRMRDVYDILNYMTGEQLFTHQLIRAAKVCTPILLEQHPFLAEIDTETVSREMEKLATKEARAEHRDRWLADLGARYPLSLEIEPLEAGIYEYQDPGEELNQMMNREGA